MQPVRPVVAACVLLAAALPVWARGNISHFVDKMSCESGPYALKLPGTYAELRKIADETGEWRRYVAAVELILQHSS